MGFEWIRRRLRTSPTPREAVLVPDSTNPSRVPTSSLLEEASRRRGQWQQLQAGLRERHLEALEHTAVEVLRNGADGMILDGVRIETRLTTDGAGRRLLTVSTGEGRRVTRDIPAAGRLSRADVIESVVLALANALWNSRPTDASQAAL